jgi:hypothetical protein
MTAGAKSTALTEEISVRYKITPALLAALFCFSMNLAFAAALKFYTR